ncbi:MAG: Na+/H+ antiporter, partial [Sphingomonas sp.]
LWVAAGGIAVGVAVTLAVTRAKAWVSNRFGEETGSQILISLLIPFGSYLMAEHLHCSGILAAVAAGVTMSFAEISRQALATTRMRRNSVWDTIQFAANGIIFVLLGEQLPDIIANAGETVRLSGHVEPWWLGVYVIAITLSLALLRFLWVWASFKLTLFRRRNDGTPTRKIAKRLLAAMSFAGVRGAITLAGVLTLPLTMNDGTPFPARDLAIFLAAGVIIVSLLAASIALPLLLRGLTMPSEPSKQVEEDRARVAAAKAAIREVERVQHALADGRGDADVYASAGTRIMDTYRERIERRTKRGEAAAQARRDGRIERDLRLAALHAERDEIFRIARDREIGSETAKKLIREIDLAEARHRV